MKLYDWNEQKNVKLKLERGIGFESIVDAINEGNLLDVIRHPNTKKYGQQKVYIVKVNNYVYSIPFIDNKDVRFLKTIYPSRKYTRKYIKGKE